MGGATPHCITGKTTQMGPLNGWQELFEVIDALGKLKYFVPHRHRPDVRPAGRPVSMVNHMTSGSLMWMAMVF